MGLVSLECPRCSSRVVLDGDKDYGTCVHCGWNIYVVRELLEKHARPVSVIDIESMKDRMFSHSEFGDIGETHEFVSKILYLDRRDPDAWYMDGVCVLDESDYPMDDSSLGRATASFDRFTELTGLPVNVDAEAFKRYLKLAKNGDARAQHKVGTMYSRGMAVEKSQENAMNWFKKAYQQGYTRVRPEISDALRQMRADKYTIPSFVDKVWDRMFEGTSFKSVTIPEPISHIGNRAFAECTDLETVELPKTLKYIGDEAFYRCSSLRTISVPRFATIGKDAFKQSGIESAGMSEHLKPLPTSTPKKTPAPVRSEPKPSVSESILTKDNYWMFRFATAIFPIICIWALLDTFGSFIGMILSAPCFLNIFCRITDEAMAISIMVNIFLAIGGIFMGFAFSVFHGLLLVCIIDAVVMYFLLVWAEKAGC